MGLSRPAGTTCPSRSVPSREREDKDWPEFDELGSAQSLLDAPILTPNPDIAQEVANSFPLPAREHSSLQKPPRPKLKDISQTTKNSPNTQPSPGGNYFQIMYDTDLKSRRHFRFSLTKTGVGERFVF